ncbi:hypothetical protein [Enterobacteria phage UAB_Phi20]|nr:hypothetical protein BI085_gp67 [Enterobacteria phage UAB_Phi20]ADM32327.1 hypothetical protein [Enterobacteria phage UAB_Phi20]
MNGFIGTCGICQTRNFIFPPGKKNAAHIERQDYQGMILQ